MAYPVDLAYLQPFAAQCHLVGDYDACNEVWFSMTGDQHKIAIELFRLLVANQQQERLTSWAGSDDSDDAGEAWCLVIFFDYLVRTGKVPPELANEHLIDWDSRDRDDFGNEW